MSPLTPPLASPAIPTAAMAVQASNDSKAPANPPSPANPVASPGPAIQAAAFANAGLAAGRLAVAGGRQKGTKGAAEIAPLPPALSARAGGKPALQSSLPAEEAQSPVVGPIGTAIAKQNLAMSTTAQLPEAEINFRADAPVAAHVTQTPSQPASAAVKTAPQQQASQQPVVPVAAFSVSSSATFAAKASTAGTAAMPEQRLASTALNQVMESADKMTSDGSSHVQVQVKLDDGQQLIVRLQMSQGTVHATFKTESPELRQAIEQSWTGFRSGASERGLQISNPVFESSSGEGGFNAFGSRNQSNQPDGDPSDADGGAAPAAPAFQIVGNPIVTTTPATSTVGSSVQMYA